MKFSYLVRHNGIDYPIGTDVPIGEVGSKETVLEPKKEEKTYTKSEITLMRVAELKKVANEYGIDISGKNGKELKEEICKYLGL